MIKPTVGRIVWYWAFGKNEHMQPERADVCYVYGDRMVNLKVTSHEGIDRPETSVALLQEGDPVPLGNSRFCEWMPYQMAQAKIQPAASGN